MSKKLLTCTRKFLRSDATCLSPKAIEEIRNAQNNIPDAQHIICKKHHIGATTYQKIIDNQRPPEPTEDAKHDTSPTNIQEDEIIHTEHPRNDKDAKGESSPMEKNRMVNSFKDNISRRESDLNKLLNITGTLLRI
ncbi:2562_t:CDS:2 [Gigaspora margarita]|uniref:2562_t:CDS:1 n=1 Tax=Gigaspora margarita TaxID=4874 RepID=A0ABN7ULQ3_GIGMA|nr:2562_t:CDS:2 [Gigaspora margarita]